MSIESGGRRVESTDEAGRRKSRFKKTLFGVTAALVGLGGGGVKALKSWKDPSAISTPASATPASPTKTPAVVTSAELENVKNQSAERLQELFKARGELIRLQAAVDQTQADKDSIQRQLDEAEKKLKTSSGLSAAEIALIESKQKVLEAQLAALEEKLKIAKEKLSTSETLSRLLRKRLGDIETALNGAEKGNKSLLGEQDLLQKELKIVQDDLVRERKEFSSASTAQKAEKEMTEATLQRLTKERDSLMEKIKQISERLSGAEKGNKSLLGEQDLLQKELKIVQDDLVRERKEFSSASTAQKAEKEMTEATLQRLTKERDSLRADKKMAEENLQVLSDNKDVLEGQISTISGLLAGEQRGNETLMIQKKKLVGQIAELERTIDVEKNRGIALENELRLRIDLLDKERNEHKGGGKKSPTAGIFDRRP
ncbi:MAG: hypothetical protein WCI76_00835 [bacterium]